MDIFLENFIWSIHTAKARFFPRFIVPSPYSKPARYSSMVYLCATWHINISILQSFEFVKQSDGTCHCDQLIAELTTVLPKIPVNFAEFPKVDSPEHLRLFLFEEQKMKSN